MKKQKSGYPNLKKFEVSYSLGFEENKKIYHDTIFADNINRAIVLQEIFSGQYFWLGKNCYQLISLTEGE